MPMLAKTALIALALLLAACAAPDGPVAIQTQDHPPPACDLSAVRGMLVADPTWGLALRLNTPDNATVQPRTLGVVWPHGYSARREHGIVVLLDQSGYPVAKEGDEVLTGPSPADNVVYPCGSIQVVR